MASSKGIYLNSEIAGKLVEMLNDFETRKVFRKINRAFLIIFLLSIVLYACLLIFYPKTPKIDSNIDNNHIELYDDLGNWLMAKHSTLSEMICC